MLNHAALADLAGRSYRGPWSGRVALDCKYDLLPRADEVIVVMPGTDPADPLDWLRDLRAAPYWSARVGLVHAGFGHGGEAIFANLLGALAGETRVLTLTGHSLGGALAQMLAALWAAYRPGRPFRLVTFGAPRVGFLNPWFAHLVRRGFERIEYARDGDIVPRVPTRPPFNHPTWPKQIGKAVSGTPSALAEFFDIAKINKAIPANHSIQRYAADLEIAGL